MRPPINDALLLAETPAWEGNDMYQHVNVHGFMDLTIYGVPPAPDSRDRATRYHVTVTLKPRNQHFADLRGFTSLEEAQRWALERAADVLTDALRKVVQLHGAHSWPTQHPRWPTPAANQEAR